MVTDEQLLADYLQGDKSAFAELVRRYQQELYSFLQRFVADATIAEDLFQETFIQVYRNAGLFDPQRRFRPWLFTIAANKARDYLRSSGRRASQSLDNTTGRDDASAFIDLMQSESPPPPEELIAAEDIAKVQEVLQTMPAIYREVLILSYFHRFAYKEIAEMQGVPLGTVKSRLHAALASFARLWKSRYGPG